MNNMSVSSSSSSARSFHTTRSNIEAGERPIMAINISNRRDRLVFVLRSVVTVLLFIGWTYACGWGLQMLLAFANYNNPSWSKLSIGLSILFVLLFAAWIVIALLRLVWKQRRTTRTYWSWRRPRNNNQESSTPPSMFFNLTLFQEGFSSSEEILCSNETMKQSVIRLLVASHVYPMFMIFIFWPFYLFLLHKNFNGWHLSMPSSVLLLAFSSILYQYVFLGGWNSGRPGEEEYESFFLFPDEPDGSPLAIGLLSNQREEEQSQEALLVTEQKEDDYRNADNL